MFKIEAIIRPDRLEAVREALEEIDLIGMTVSDCRGTGRQRAVTHTFRGSQYGSSYNPRVRLEIAVLEVHLNSAVEAIQTAANTGEVGDGKILVTELHQVVNIRTNERGESALS